MAAGGPSALLVSQQTKWDLTFFSRPPISVSPSCRDPRFLAGRPATGGATRLATSAAVRPDATILTHSFASSVKTHFPKCFVSRPPADLGLLSLFFVISMAMGAFLSVAVISLPTMSAFRRLAVSMEKLSKVASVEVPGTLSSLKLSGLEINDLTQQLSGLSIPGIGRLFKRVTVDMEMRTLLSCVKGSIFHSSTIHTFTLLSIDKICLSTTDPYLNYKMAY